MLPLPAAGHDRGHPQPRTAAAGTEEELASRLAAIEPRIGAFVCCLGTTLRDAGSREAFVAVDRELVLRLARIARTLGADHAVLVSSVGASAQSGNFYMRVKGEVERRLGGLPNVRLIPPQGYRNFVALMAHSRLVLTDSRVKACARLFRELWEVSRAFDGSHEPPLHYRNA